MENRFEKILKKGYWIYNGKKIELCILKQNWDYFYEEGYEEESPDINKNGHAFYVIFGNFQDLKNANRSRTCLSLEEAISLAKTKVSSSIYWDISFS